MRPNPAVTAHGNTAFDELAAAPAPPPLPRRAFAALLPVDERDTVAVVPGAAVNAALTARGVNTVPLGDAAEHSQHAVLADMIGEGDFASLLRQGHECLRADGRMCLAVGPCHVQASRESVLAILGQARAQFAHVEEFAWNGTEISQTDLPSGWWYVVAAKNASADRRLATPMPRLIAAQVGSWASAEVTGVSEVLKRREAVRVTLQYSLPQHASAEVQLIARCTAESFFWIGWRLEALQNHPAELLLPRPLWAEVDNPTWDEVTGLEIRVKPVGRPVIVQVQKVGVDDEA